MSLSAYRISVKKCIIPHMLIKFDLTVSEILNVKLRAPLTLWWCCGAPIRFIFKMLHPDVRTHNLPKSHPKCKTDGRSTISIHSLFM